MPYVLVSTQIRLENGPCTVGDEESDPELMRYLGAKLVQQLGNNFMEWRTDTVPRIVLERLERRGYKLLTQTGIGQTCIWTLHRPFNEGEKQLVAEEEERRKKYTSADKCPPLRNGNSTEAPKAK